MARKRSKKLETGVSLFLLFVILCIFLGIFFKQFRYEKKLYEIGISGNSIIEESEDSATNDLSFLISEDFKVFSKISSYDPENLYVKINGKADLYLESGFENLASQRFISKSDESLWFEAYIYDMGSAINALSVFGRQRRPGAENTDISRFSYATGNSVFMAKGKYYLEIIGSAENNGLMAGIMAFGRNFAEEKKSDAEAIAELELFPAKNLDSSSFKFYPQEAFGFDKFGDIFAAKYVIGDEEITCFISERADEEQARELAEGYYNFLMENGAEAVEKADNALPGQMADLYGSIEWVHSSGKFLLGVHDAMSQGPAEALARMLCEEFDGKRNE